MDLNKKTKKFRLTEYVPVWCIVLLAIAAIAAIIEIVARNNIALADLINDTSGRVIRLALAKMTSWIPFSLAETLVIFSPMVVVIIVALVSSAGRRSTKALVRLVAMMLSLISVIYSSFIFGYGTGYYGKGIDEKLGFERKDVSAQELYDTALKLLSGAKAELDDVLYPQKTYSSMPYSYSELNKKLNYAWGVIGEKYSCFQIFTSNAKPVMLSEPWTYTHIAGVYCFFTGEANVNTNYPDYVMISSAAHEMAHQRGISREDEANFASFLACINSDDPYIRYCGYVDNFSEVRNQLYSADYELYEQLMAQVPSEIRGEFTSYSLFFDKYRENIAATVNDKVNDTYITYHGQEAGSKSYGLVVDLLCAYMLYGGGANN